MSKKKERTEYARIESFMAKVDNEVQAKENAWREAKQARRKSNGRRRPDRDGGHYESRQ